MNKREFVLSGCATALATAAWVGVARATADPASESVPTRHAQWLALLGEEFVARTAPNDTLRLDEVRRVGQTTGHEEFTLVFVAAAARTPRPAGLALLRRDNGSHMALYLEPMEHHPQSGQARCAAHFSLLT